jgi:hypothetical protein
VSTAIWGCVYRDHEILFDGTGDAARITAFLNDRSGPGFTRVACRTVASAKRRITVHVNRKGYALSEMIRTTAWRLRKVNIEVDTAFEHVAIGQNVFLQGEEAGEFIEEAEKLWERAGDVGRDDCYAFLAAPIYETLEN